MGYNRFDFALFTHIRINAFTHIPIFPFSLSILTMNHEPLIPIYSSTHSLIPLQPNVGKNHRFLTGEENITKNFKNSKVSYKHWLYIDPDSI